MSATLDDFRERLAARLAATRVPIDDDARSLIDALIDAGVRRMRDEGADAARRAEAEDALRVILADMTQQARILRLDVLGPPALASALGRLGPLWPWC